MTGLPPLIPGVPDLDEPPLTSDCGCCAGVDTASPIVPENPPGLSAITFRPGAYADFRAAQIAGLSTAPHPALARLRTRDADDFTIALIDAWAVTLDVLSFYQERLANEAYLATAIERRSLIEQSRLIGYHLRPGVAAGTDLVFVLEQPPGAETTVPGVTIEPGSRVQSVPGPGEAPVTFETTAPLDARVAWNALAPRQSVFRPPQNGDTGLWLAGIQTGLKTGDAVLIKSNVTVSGQPAEYKSFRKLTGVSPDATSGRTYISFAPALAMAAGATAQAHAVFAFRARTSLFGWNAPHPSLLSKLPPDPPNAVATAGTKDWVFTIDRTNRKVTLDGAQEGWGPGSWLALTLPTGVVEVYSITAAVDDGMSRYAVSGKATTLTLTTGTNLIWFESQYRATAAYGRSETLPLAEAPITTPVMGDTIELANRPEPLPEGRRVMLRGRRAQAILSLDVTLTDNQGGTLALPQGSRVTVLTAPEVSAGNPAEVIVRLRGEGGFAGMTTMPATGLGYTPADKSSEIVAEPAIVRTCGTTDETHAAITFEDALIHCYDRATTMLHANVAPATHGETTEEVLGDGQAHVPHQRFALKDGPVTHVAAATDSGTASTIELRVGDVQWREVPTLYQAGPTDRVFETRLSDEGRTIISFGDGVRGARLPTGRNNIVASYRKGLGRAGSVKAGALTTALDRPLGFKDVFNPLNATGGDDAETLENARVNAPITTLTLGRVVSLQNYEDFARSFAGIARAKVDYLWDGEARRILLTVAGPDGALIETGGVTHTALLAALRRFGDPLVRLQLAGYRPALFRLWLRVKVHADYEDKAVLAGVEAALRAAFDIKARSFEPGITASQIIACAQEVAGVVALDLEHLYRVTAPAQTPGLHQRLLAQPASVDAQGVLLGAEILALDTAPLTLEVMA
jgi:hypothetical protein